MPRNYGTILARIDYQRINQIAQVLSLSNARMEEEWKKTARPAGRAIVNELKRAAPSDQGLFRRKGIKLSVRRFGVYVRVVGFPGGRLGRPYNIHNLLQDGHRVGRAGRTRPNTFVRRTLRRTYPRYQAEVERGIDNVIDWMHATLAKRQRIKSTFSASERSARGINLNDVFA